MDCPVCKTAMITLELNEVEIDHCLECSGIWLDAGELEMLLDDSKQAQELLSSFTAAKNCTEKPRKCPICLKKMGKILVGPENSTQLIDKCRKDDGLWTQVEYYVKDHSEVDFSHGICPDCMKKHYGEYLDDEG